ncbi:MAG: glutathione S-transferase family protein [Myxococcota bacterium]
MYTLYGIPPSLYTGKVRSYLIKQRIPYREVAPETHHYEDVVLPKAGGRRGMPTIESPDGDVIRDGAVIVDHFEARNGHRSLPEGACQRILALILDAVGMEGLMRPAMHYRWNFPEENERLLSFHFTTMTPPGKDPQAHAERLMDAMRGFTGLLGVTPESMQGVERRYEALLTRLDRHFAAYPYVFGGRPSIADFSLIGPFYGHLGRDPKPLAMMQSGAIHVLRWVERMHRPDLAHVDYIVDGREVFEDAFLPEDAVPETLVAVLQQLAIDFVPETAAAAAQIDVWLAEQPSLAPGTPAERYVGVCTFEVEGEALQAIAQPYRFFLLQRAQDAFDALPDPERTRVAAFLERCGLKPVLEARLSRRLGRADNLEVWLDA